MITVADIMAAVAEIEALRDDPEVAHGKEDDLHQAVLEEIAKGNPEASELATAALKTKDIEYPRWYA